MPREEIITIPKHFKPNVPRPCGSGLNHKNIPLAIEAVPLKIEISVVNIAGPCSKYIHQIFNELV
jgi:hypothetical protein